MVSGDREAIALAATLGREVREGRARNHWRLVDLGERTGISTSHLGRIERGEAASVPLRTWVRLGIALDRPLAVRFSDPIGPQRLVDAGHLELQEWVLAMARRRGLEAGLEIPTRATDPTQSVDVLVRAGRVLELYECWNTIRDFGAAVRATIRKVAQAEQLAAAVGADAVRACWLVRPTAANRGLVRAYPEAVRAAFRGSSAAWVTTITEGGPPPADGIGFVWLDPTMGPRAMRIRGT